ncbi:MAG: hypothetical protein ACO1NU_17020 [Arcticibacter sp.]
MKKTFIAALLMAGLATSGMAQGRVNQVQSKDGGRGEKGRHRVESPEQQARKATERLDRELSLTEKQRSEVYKIHLDRAKNMAISREKAQKQRLKEIKKMESERSDSEKKLNRILNSQQQAKYASLKQSRAEKFKDRRAYSSKKRGDMARRDSSNRSRASVRPGR